MMTPGYWTAFGIPVLTILLLLIVIIAASFSHRSLPFVAQTLDTDAQTRDCFSDRSSPVVDGAFVAQTLNTDAQTRAYFSRMTEADLRANSSECRHTNDTAESRYLRSVLDPSRMSERDMARVTEVVALADALVSPLLSATEAPWRVAVLKDGGFGAQFPHTLGGIVCMPERFFRGGVSQDVTVSTLVHERVHIFQRMFPRETHRLLVEHWHLRRVCRNSELVCGRQGELPPIRSNPDLDGWVWTHTDNGDDDDEGGIEVAAQVYTSHRPRDLSDSVVRSLRHYPHGFRGSGRDREAEEAGTPRYEHPYERMAYELQDILTRRVSLPPDHPVAMWARLR